MKKLNENTDYDIIANIIENNKDDYNEILTSLDKEIIIKGRDNLEKKVPIYLTKARVKNPSSIYLKSKIDKIEKKLNTRETIEQSIEDLLGYRILCMFEQDIERVNKFLLESAFNELDAKIEKIKVFNWDDKRYQFLVDTTKKYTEIIPVSKKKESGYKSIHYLISKKIKRRKINIEIQLRTLLQDVWGELEHSLVYKQNSIHPHIKKSFQLLSIDLSRNDNLMTHLKKISNEEVCVTKGSLTRTKPHEYFTYGDRQLFPDILEDDDRFKSLYHDYSEQIQNLSNDKCYKSNISVAKKKFKEIQDEIKGKDKKTCPNLAYWEEMENTFFLFADKQYEEALESYKKIIEKDNEKYYIPRFRIAEIYFILNENHRALSWFNKCLDILQSNNYEYSSDLMNKYKIQIRVSLVYWNLGDSFIDLALENALEAEKTFLEIERVYKDKITIKQRVSLANNLCWYFLEKYIKVNNDYLKNPSNQEISNKYEISKKEVEQRYKTVKSFIDKEKELNANLLDTAAWYCFQKYKTTNEIEDLEESLNYVSQVKSNTLYSIFTYTSHNVHNHHLKEIICESLERGIDIASYNINI